MWREQVNKIINLGFSILIVGLMTASLIVITYTTLTQNVTQYAR